MDFRSLLPVSQTKTWLFPAALGALTLTGCIPALVPTSPMVSGRVTDGRTGQPVAGAVVTVRVDRETPGGERLTKAMPRTLSDGNGQFALPEQQGLGIFHLLGSSPVYQAVVSIRKEGYEKFTTKQRCNGSDGTPSTPLHVFTMLKPERRSE